MQQVWKFYQAIPNCIVLRECERFEEPVLEELLNTIRRATPQQRVIRPEVWERLLQCYAGAPEHLDDSGVDRRFQQQEFLDAIFMSQEWAIVAREQQQRVVRNSRRKGELVYYAQAVDSCKFDLSREEHHRFLQYPNLIKTARMMGLLGVHNGMRVRITRRLQPADQVVQDAPGTVLSVLFDDRENIDFYEDDTHPAWARGWVRLRYLPKAIFVLLDDHRPRVCDKCRGDACPCSGKACAATCTASCAHHPGTIFAEGERPGVLALSPEEDISDGINLAGDTRKKVRITRRQFPIAPLAPGTVNSYQGASATYAICNLMGSQGDLEFATQGARETFWRHVYVMLSRCRRIENLLLLNPPDNLKEILEAGPPAHVLCFPKEARLAADRAAAHLASGGKRTRQSHSKMAPPSTEKQGKGGKKGGAPRWRPQTPALQFKVAVWDYLPSPVVEGFANSLNRQNNLQAHSSIESLQNSLECGYIAAKILAHFLDSRVISESRTVFPLLTANETRDLAVEAMFMIEDANNFLANVETSSVKASPHAQWLEILDVMDLAVFWSNLHDYKGADLTDETWFCSCPVDDGEGETCWKTMQEYAPHSDVVALLTTASRGQDGRYNDQSHFVMSHWRLQH